MNEPNLKRNCACSYNKKPGQSCMSDETKKKIKTLAGVPKFNNLMINNVLNDTPGDIEELNILLHPEIILELGRETILKELDNYKPIGPTDTSYFNNFVEDNVVQHLHKYDPTFYPCKVQLFDFMNPNYTFDSTLTDILKPENLEKIKSGEIKTFGCVLNTLKTTDNLTKVGHWVAIFGDFRGEHNTIEYFNSSGRNAPPEVFSWMEKAANTISKYTGRKCIAVNATNVVHQRSDTECGAYSLYYITSRLVGISYKQYRKSPIEDKHVTKFRSHVLNDQNKIKNLEFLKGLKIV